ncbi:FAD-dependent oxidoreductase [candidate division WWE3 bacterium]|uniref:NADH:ubiquinone reductase (non-electrogenic) n=1 Tax=candidate division WWE3 bacterium TaxID=2053526 RepID=A0A955E194_UNCKA|nr:FAD-dependent oxidoreductase [candidate division WWE3 bacterium]HXK52750.1 FAD-dependent oxidoreductase [bacterium]
MNENKIACSTPPIKVVIVGGGPTGVELVAELAEYMHGTLARLYKHVGPGQNQILLLNSAGHLLGSFDKRLGERIEKYLVQKLNVKVINNSKIISIEDFVIKSSNGEIRGADVIIDASGVRAMYPDLIPAIDTDEKNNIITDDFLRIPEYPNVYALGDVGQFYKLAQTAVNQAEYAAKSIVNLMLNKQPKQYTFKPKGFLLSLGKNYAIGSLFNVLIFGKPVWFLWRTIYLFKVLNSRHRIKIALNWTLNLFSDRDTTNI